MTGQTRRFPQLSRTKRRGPRILKAITGPWWHQEMLQRGCVWAPPPGGGYKARWSIHPFTLHIFYLGPTRCQELFSAGLHTCRVPDAGDTNSSKLWYLPWGWVGNGRVTPKCRDRSEHCTDMREGAPQRDAGRPLRQACITLWSLLPSTCTVTHLVSSAPWEWTFFCSHTEHKMEGQLQRASSWTSSRTTWEARFLPEGCLARFQSEQGGAGCSKCFTASTKRGRRTCLSAGRVWA